MFRNLAARLRTQRHEHTPAERALRMLWSPQVFEISDVEFAEIGRLLGLDDLSLAPQHQPDEATPTPQHRKQVPV